MANKKIILEMKETLPKRDHVKFDAEYFAKLLKVAIGSRTVNDFMVQSGINNSMIFPYLHEIATKPMPVNDLKKVSDAAWNDVTFEELAYASVGVKYQNRRVNITPDYKQAYAIIEKEMKQYNYKKESRKIRAYAEDMNIPYNVLRVLSFLAKDPNYSVVGFGLKSIQMIANTLPEKEREKFIGYCGYATKKNSIAGPLTPVKVTPFRKIINDLITEYGLEELAKAVNLTEKELMALANLKSSDKRPDLNILHKFSKVLSPEKMSKLYLSAGHVYHEIGNDWDLLSKEKVREMNKKNSEKFQEYLIRIIGNRSKSEFAEDSHMSISTVDNLIHGRTMPRLSGIQKLVMASADKSITCDDLFKACGTIPSRNAKIIYDKDAFKDYKTYVCGILKMHNQDILHYAASAGLSRNTATNFFTGNNCTPSCKTLYKISKYSNIPYEELVLNIKNYYTEYAD